MSIDVVDLRNFYGQRLGVVARRFVGRGIRGLWKDTAGQRVLGVGYATPYLGLFREEAERCLAFMPAGQGVVKWPTTRPALSALVDENELPLPDSAVAAAAMTPAPAMPEAILAVALLMTVLPGALIGVLAHRLLRLAAAAGDEGRQRVRVRDGHIAALNRRLRIRLLLRLRLRAVLLLIARRKRLRVARQIGLRLRCWRLRREARLVLAHEM